MGIEDGGLNEESRERGVLFSVLTEGSREIGDEEDEAPISGSSGTGRCNPIHPKQDRVLRMSIRNRLRVLRVRVVWFRVRGFRVRGSGSGFCAQT
jgi:hypothetical protein